MKWKEQIVEFCGTVWCQQFTIAYYIVSEELEEKLLKTWTQNNDTDMKMLITLFDQDTLYTHIAHIEAQRYKQLLHVN